MRCADCRWFHKENEICLKTGDAVLGIYIDTECEYANNMTVFERVTASPEVLAHEFVGMVYDRVCCDYRYYSMLTDEFYNSEDEAIAATVEKLKEVCQ